MKYNLSVLRFLFFLTPLFFASHELLRLKPTWKSIKKLDNLSLIETQNNNLYAFIYNKMNL